MDVRLFVVLTLHEHAPTPGIVHPFYSVTSMTSNSYTVAEQSNGKFSVVESSTGFAVWVNLTQAEAVKWADRYMTRAAWGI